MSVFRIGKETPITVDKATKKVLEKMKATLPDGIEFTMWNSRADMFYQRMQLLLRNGLFGLILVFFVLGLFLEMRLAFWVMLGIPISFLGTIFFMPALGLSVNMVSMFAFILALGIVVDDAIVVGENIYHYHQSGMSFLRSAIKGARQIAMPVTFSILTNIVAFMPLYFVPGTMGKFFGAIPLVVCTTFLISLVEAMFILPAHLGHQKEKKKPSKIHHFQQRFSKGFTRFVQNKYAPFLDFTLRWRYVTFAIGIVILIITISYIKSGRMGFQLFPSVESDIAVAKFALPYGAPIEKTEAIYKHILRAGEEVAKAIEKETGKKQIKGSLSFIGSGGSHKGSIIFDLVDPKERPVSTTEFTQRWRKKTGALTGVDTLRFRADSGGPGGHNQALTIELSHRNITQLESAAKDLAQKLSEYSIVSDIDSGVTRGKPQIDLTLKPEGRSLGLTSFEVARQLRYAYYGAEAIRQQRGRNEVKTMVRLPKSERQSEFSLESMIIRTPAGTEVPLNEIAHLKRGRAYTTINRRNGHRTVSVTANVTPQSKTPDVLNDIKQNYIPKLIQHYSGLTFSFEGKQAEKKESMTGLRNGLFAAILLIYIILAIPFKSYGQPLIIMVSIPFGIIGAVLGHLIMHYSLSVISIFGIVALSGVVVNDSLVLIDFFNQKRNEGLSRHDAIISAGVQRFRPIVLTTLTTFFGLMPMIFEQSRQARFLIPMAISLGFGILFATLITLVLIPSLTLILEDLGHLFGKNK